MTYANEFLQKRDGSQTEGSDLTMEIFAHIYCTYWSVCSKHVILTIFTYCLYFKDPRITCLHGHYKCKCHVHVYKEL